jgi:hypothetical protein
MGQQDVPPALRGELDRRLLAHLLEQIGVGGVIAKRHRGAVGDRLELVRVVGNHGLGLRVGPGDWLGRLRALVGESPDQAPAQDHHGT